MCDSDQNAVCSKGQECSDHWRWQACSQDLPGQQLYFNADKCHRGLGAEVARRFAAEGCNIAINYVSSEAPAQTLSKELQDKHKVKTTVVQGDGGVVADIQNCVQQTIKAFGGLDIIIGNAGFTRFSDFKDLDALSYEEWDKYANQFVEGTQHITTSRSLPLIP